MSLAACNRNAALTMLDAVGAAFSFPEVREMTLPPNDSIIWTYVRMLLLSAILYAFCEFAYHNHIATQDFLMILTAVGAISGVDFAKHSLSPPARAKPAAKPPGAGVKKKPPAK